MKGNPAGRLYPLWQRLSRWPGGRRLFSLLVGRMVPYSGSIGATVESLEPGHAVVTLRDRRAVRNHLRSVHAIAQTNLGELTSGLAMLTALPPGVRGIVTAIRTEYMVKARGTLTATSSVVAPVVSGPVDMVVRASVSNAVGEITSETTVHWRLDRSD